MKDWLLAEILAHLATASDQQDGYRLAEGMWTKDMAGYCAQASLPTRKTQGWQNVALQTWLSARYCLHEELPSGLPESVVAAPREKEALVFVDGVWVPSLSTIPPTVTVSEGIFSHDMAEGATLWQSFLDALPPSEVFARLGLALSQGYTRLRVAGGSTDRVTIHVYHYVTSQKSCLVRQNLHGVVASGCKLDLVQHPVVRLPGAQALVVCNQYWCVEDRASLCQTLCQETAADLGVLWHTYASCGRDSYYQAGFVGLCRSLLRWYCGVDLLGRGAEASLRGISMPSASGQLDIQGVVRHMVAHTQSRQHVKAAAADAAVSGFCGRVFVAKDAQHVDSSQVNHNLLLGSKARVFSKPELEIYADEVKCAHGSTVGSLDPAQLFYLQSRGLDLAHAKKLLVQGFVRAVFDESEQGAGMAYGQDLVARFLAELS